MRKSDIAKFMTRILADVRSIRHLCAERTKQTIDLIRKFILLLRQIVSYTAAQRINMDGNTNIQQVCCMYAHYTFNSK